ncbi:MAG TPA: GNAT family N-acetyltransferase [Stellaceae bacterium]|nr:GNAT family N-acetyltransferase [Stellaceae bacterium]
MAREPTSVPVLETPRLRLRPFKLKDAPGFHEAYGDPEAMRFWDFPAYATLAETERDVRWSMKRSPSAHGIWAVASKEGDRCIGMVNYHHRERRNRRLEVGYILARKYWRQGLMTEAMTALLDYCFEMLRAHRIEALIDPENTASISLAKGLGFHCESGPMRDRLLVNGKFQPQVMYALVGRESLIRRHGDLAAKPQ